MEEILFTEDSVQYSVLLHDGVLVEMLKCVDGHWEECTYVDWLSKWCQI